MTYPVSDLDGITNDQIEVLKRVGIRTTEKMLIAACTGKLRKILAAKTDIPEQQLLAWANNADRMRIKGIGHDNAKLLAAIGVITVRDLKHRNPEHLAKAMRDYNNKRKLVRVLPTDKAVRRWVEEAKTVELKIEY